MNEVEIPLKITGIGAIKSELRELKGAIADATDPEQIAQLSAKAGELADKIKDANEKVQVFTTGSKFESVSNSFSMIGADLASLDFEGASEKAQIFSKTLGSLNPGDLAKGFKGFTGVVQTMGGAFVKLGAQILANPIFLLVAVIVAIVAAIAIFLNKIGVLDKILKVLMAPINAIIEGFKMLTDMLGLTDNAAEENAEAVKAASEKNREQLARESKARQDLFNLTKDLSDEEVKAIEEKLGIQIDTSQSIFDLKREQIEGDMAINQAEIDSLNMKKSLTDEDKKRLADLNKTQADLANQQVQNEVNKINAIRNLNISLDKQIETLQAKQIKNESERAKAMLDIQLKEALAKVDLQIKDAKQLGDASALAKAQQLRNLIIQDFKRQELEITNKGNAAVSKANVTSVTNTNREVENDQTRTLKKMRQANETALQLAERDNMKEEDLRKLRISQLEKEAEYIIANKKKLYKTTADQDAAIAKIELDLKKARDKNLEEQEKADNDRLIATLKRKEVNAEDDIAKFEIQKQLVEAENKLKLNALEVGSEERLLLEDQIAQQIKDIDDQIKDKKIENEQKILAAAQLVAETKLSREQFDLERSAKTDEQKLEAAKTLLQSELDLQAAQKATELGNKELTEEEIAAIEEKYRQQKITAEENSAKTIEQIKKDSNARIFAEIDKGLDTSVQGLNAISSLLTISQNNKLKGVKKGSAEEEKVLKQQFKQQKAMQLAMAAINGAQAITAILSVPDFTFGIASGIRIAAAVAATAASISSIASTTFQGGGTPPNLDLDTGGAAGGVSSATPATPNVNLFGSANQFNNLGSTGQANGQTVTVQAVVSETDITNVQNKISNIQKNAEL